MVPIAEEPLDRESRRPREILFKNDGTLQRDRRILEKIRALPNLLQVSVVVSRKHHHPSLLFVRSSSCLRLFNKFFGPK